MINKDIERYENHFSYKKKKENENFTIWYKRFFGGIVDGLFFIMCQQAYISENFTYVETEEMSEKDKLKDLEIMIDTFVEEERYEDCALLVKIKKKVIKHYVHKNTPVRKNIQ